VDAVAHGYDGVIPRVITKERLDHARGMTKSLFQMIELAADVSLSQERTGEKLNSRWKTSQRYIPERDVSRLLMNRRFGIFGV
jgi:hypothetical protein